MVGIKPYQAYEPVEEGRGDLLRSHPYFHTVNEDVRGVALQSPRPETVLPSAGAASEATAGILV
ncbi:hypothetical protein CBOM_06497 [Ceraceosorus bombacis]|uniref:Uncharacterized protein n=1 Tax=Ceraceosorus bombacis TaxID=401625 RepID=A0A0P1BLB9_9BASI|nr:hypothetical protein CBOM_06497 [Ceraceosorus bombacis]